MTKVSISHLFLVIAGVVGATSLSGCGDSSARTPNVDVSTAITHRNYLANVSEFHQAKVYAPKTDTQERYAGAQCSFIAKGDGERDARFYYRTRYGEFNDITCNIIAAQEGSAQSQGGEKVPTRVLIEERSSEVGKFSTIHDVPVVEITD